MGHRLGGGDDDGWEDQEQVEVGAENLSGDDYTLREKFKEKAAGPL